MISSRLEIKVNPFASASCFAFARKGLGWQQARWETVKYRELMIKKSQFENDDCSSFTSVICSIEWLLLCWQDIAPAGVLDSPF
jgi:hypothetical protein